MLPGYTTGWSTVFVTVIEGLRARTVHWAGSGVTVLPPASTPVAVNVSVVSVVRTAEQV